ncbi:hypothetical protein G7047_08815 [Diaphorobacter sp. HDW4A]|uniref:hypothetical protein n=1 Tax=Diaphorobacter sp. HDW4A TaxID=2714924 RepID=UPI0014086C82|nr:hypothetical protein [Diaphorobacter sp. HDW4A]QIL79989.1 hypothetical protein G7047_08815 [Diaphorobacter sp. HDW4A]
MTAQLDVCASESTSTALSQLMVADGDAKVGRNGGKGPHQAARAVARTAPDRKNHQISEIGIRLEIGKWVRNVRLDPSVNRALRP